MYSFFSVARQFARKIASCNTTFRGNIELIEQVGVLEGKELWETDGLLYVSSSGLDVSASKQTLEQIPYSPEGL